MPSRWLQTHHSDDTNVNPDSFNSLERSFCFLFVSNRQFECGGGGGVICLKWLPAEPLSSRKLDAWTIVNNRVLCAWQLLHSADPRTLLLSPANNQD